MNYIIINNTYQYTDLLRYFPAKFIEKATLILIPVNIDLGFIKHNCIAQLPIFELTKSLRNPAKGLAKIRKINQYLISKNISQQDTLFVFTEIELSNQKIIEFFYRMTAPIYLIEDGTATPILFNIPLESNNLRSWILTRIISLIFSFENTRVCVFNRGYFYHLPDHYFQGLIVFAPFTINRKIPLYLAQENPPTYSFPMNTNSCLFFSQHLYKVYLPFEPFIRILTKILDSLSRQFTVIYFKFHPNETEEDRGKIRHHLKKYSTIEFLADGQAAVLAAQASFGVSFLSTALREYAYYGLRPIYLFHLFPALLPAELSDPYKVYLDSLHYIFLKDIESLEEYCKLDSFFASESQGDLQAIETIGVL